jgi:serine/threonine protein kinase
LEEMMTGKIGTSHWMAPEVLSSSKYSARADVYSFSIVMYEVITREVPYKGKKQEEIRTQVLMKELRPDLKLVPPSCPGKLITLMTLCWKQESDKRPSFSSILDLLSGVLVS